MGRAIMGMARTAGVATRGVVAETAALKAGRLNARREVRSNWEAIISKSKESFSKQLLQEKLAMLKKWAGAQVLCDWDFSSFLCK